MIYIACTSRQVTGGTEALHVLNFHLRMITKNVRMYYYNYDGIGNPTPDKFLKYNVEPVFEVEDNKKSLLIVPEISSAIEQLTKFNKLRKVVWWLSVDNYLLSNRIGIKNHVFMNSGIISLIKYQLKSSIKSLLLKHPPKCLVDFGDKSLTHLYQSEYARTFLEKHEVMSSFPLTDYIENTFTDGLERHRENYLLYNPVKGIKITRKIIKNLNNLKPIPIIGLNSIQLRELYSKSKVYIDFGSHPGKDRIPREAAINNLIVFTNRRGSAFNDKDVPIPTKFKIDDNLMRPKVIAEYIEDTLKNYNNLLIEFSDYREIILGQKLVFIDEVDYLYKEVLVFYDTD